MNQNTITISPLNYRTRIPIGKRIIDKMIRDSDKDSALYLGLELEYGKGYYVGRTSKEEGNEIIIGNIGSGKSHILAKSTLETWRDPFIALDIKGELSEHYNYLYYKKQVTRPFVIFDPVSSSEHYDPYAMLDKNDTEFSSYVREMAYAIIPKPLDVREPYWIDMARDLLSGAIIYYFTAGLDFIETMSIIQSTPAAKMCKNIMQSDCVQAKIFLSDIGNLKPEHLASISTEMKRHTMVFATDIYIQEAFSRPENGNESLTWETLLSEKNASNVFFRLSQEKLEQWSCVIRLMLTQLIRKLERRPDRTESEYIDKRMHPILVMLDEFPLLGKMDIITNGLTTLRSKKVTFCLIIQSIAQLDAIYGSNARKIIMDNCQYKVMLNITEPDSQEYFSRLIGVVPSMRSRISQNRNTNIIPDTYEFQMQDSCVPLIFPHEFATNLDIWLHTPYGFFCTIKLPFSVTQMQLNNHENTIKNKFSKEYKLFYDFYED